MAGFTIPNTPDAYNQNQAEPDSLDFQILGNQTNAVVTGAQVTPGPSGATVAVSAGEVIVGGVYYPVTASTSLALTAYASSPFFDIVVKPNALKTRQALWWFVRCGVNNSVVVCARDIAIFG